MIPAPRIILITDPRYAIEHIEKSIEDAASVLDRGDLLVQLRDKRGASDDAARRLRDATRAVGMSFVINGDAALAKRVAADGVHLGGARPDVASARAVLGSEAFVSIAAHSDDDVRYAVTTHATAVLVSPIFESPGKGPPRGAAALASARAIAGDAVLVFALGGIDDRRAAACSMADGVAVIRALLDASDARVTARGLAAPFRRRGR